MIGVWRRLAGSQSLGLAAVILAVSTLGSRVLGLLRDIVIYGAFGLSSDLDAYYAAIRIPDVIFQLLTGAALASAFIPAFTGLLARHRQEAAERLAGAILTIALVLTAALAGVGIVLAPLLVSLIAPGFTDPDQQRLTTELMRVMLLSPIFFSLSTIVGAVLNGRRRFLFTAIAPWFYNASIIGGALLLVPVIGIAGIAVGVVIGSLLHLLVQLPGFVQGFRLRPSLDTRNPDVRDVGRLAVPRIFGMAAIYINWFVVSAIASTLEPGSVATIALAWAIMLLPLSLFAMSLAQAAFPTLTELRTVGDDRGFERVATRALRTAEFLVLPSSVGLAVLGPALVGLLYQRANFTAQNTLEVAGTVSWFALGLFAHAALEVLTRIYYANRDTRTPVLTSLLSVAVNVPLGLALAVPFGTAGLAAAWSIATICETTVLAVLAGRVARYHPSPALWRGLGVTLTATAACAVVLVAWRGFVPLPDATVGYAWWLAGGTLLGGGAFLLTARLLRAEELNWTAGRVLRRLRPAGPIVAPGDDW